MSPVILGLPAPHTTRRMPGATADPGPVAEAGHLGVLKDVAGLMLKVLIAAHKMVVRLVLPESALSDSAGDDTRLLARTPLP